MSDDHQRHRGAHPVDQKLFAPEHHVTLQQAVSDLSWLASHGYAQTAALKLVGDRYALKQRQRLAVARAACSDQQREHRQQACLSFHAIKGQELLLDGFNIVVTIEAALSGGVLLHCRDSCIRDMSSVHGSYRSVTETETAIRLTSESLLSMKPASAIWLLDRPVSNSGRLAEAIRKLAARFNWPWSVEVVMNPDRVIRESGKIAVTSDSNILDRSSRWINLNKLLIEQHLPQARVVDLSGSRQMR